VYQNGSWRTIDIIEGTVTVTLESPVARTFTLKVAPSMVLVTGRRADAMTWQVYNTFIKISRGVVFADGTVEYVPLGLFIVESISASQTTEGQSVDLSGSDFFSAVQRARLLAPQGFGVLTHLSLVQILIRDSLNANFTSVLGGPVKFSVLNPSGQMSNATLNKPKVDRDRAQTIGELLRAMGAVGYFDGDGVYVIRYDPRALRGYTNNQTDAWTATQGENGVVVELTQEITRDRIYNAIVAIGESDDPKAKLYTGIAKDMDPKSPTYWLGPFGQVPGFFNSKYLSNQTVANNAAATALKAAKIMHKRINIKLLPDYSLEPGDKVRILFPGAEPKDDTWEIHCLTSLTYSLGPEGALDGTCSLFESLRPELSRKSEEVGIPWATP
jgi:hypothetical protein